MVDGDCKYIKEAYATLKEHGLYIPKSPCIKELNRVCYERIYENKFSNGKIRYPELGPGKYIVYSFKSYRPPIIKLVTECDS